MSTTTDKRNLRISARALASAEESAATWRRERDALIVKLVGAGCPPGEVATQASVSRQYVSKITKHLR